MTQTACLALAVSLLYLVSRLALLSTLFPYTTLFRSLAQLQAQALLAARIEFPGDRHTVRLPGAQRVARRRLDLRSEEHTSELQSLTNLVCRLLLETKNCRNRPRSTPRTPARRHSSRG